MRTNGTLRYELDAECLLNEYGEVVPLQNQWSEPIPCLVITNSDNRRGRYEDGEFHIASYTLLIEGSCPQPLHRIRITRGTEDLGEHRVIGIIPIQTYNRTQIVV